VLQLVSTDQLTVDLQVSETFLGAIEPGEPLELRFAGNETVAARVTATVPVTDPTSRTFLVRAQAVEPSAAMYPGVSVTASLALDTGRARTTVPRDAVLRYADGRAVIWVVETVDGIDRAQERLVQTGLSFQGLIEISSGIEAGDRVVVVGNEALRNDQPVRVVGSS
jgi:RND family efflux transporter MFP subunit